MSDIEGRLDQLDTQPGDIVQFIKASDGFGEYDAHFEGKLFTIAKDGCGTECGTWVSNCSHIFKIIKRASDQECDSAMHVQVEPGYEPLAEELIKALNQSQLGKGVKRHANARPFLKQPIMEMGRMCGPGGPAQQVMKKTQEALGMANRGQHDRAIAELHGAIVYAAACAILINEKSTN